MHLKVTVPYAGMTRIRFDGLACASQPFQQGTPTVVVKHVNLFGALGKGASLKSKRPAKASPSNQSQQTLKFGGAKRDRTADLLNAIQALSQLSYGPTEVRHAALRLSTQSVSAVQGEKSEAPLHR